MTFSWNEEGGKHVDYPRGRRQGHALDMTTNSFIRRFCLLLLVVCSLIHNIEVGAQHHNNEYLMSSFGSRGLLYRLDNLIAGCLFFCPLWQETAECFRGGSICQKSSHFRGFVRNESAWNLKVYVIGIRQHSRVFEMMHILRWHAAFWERQWSVMCQETVVPVLRVSVRVCGFRKAPYFATNVPFFCQRYWNNTICELQWEEMLSLLMPLLFGVRDIYLLKSTFLVCGGLN